MAEPDRCCPPPKRRPARLPRWPELREGLVLLFRRDRLPVLSLIVVAVATVAALSPVAAQAMIFERDAILRGQLWRLWTGNCVHFGLLHWFLDTGLFLILGRLMEWRFRRLIRVAYVALPLGVTGAVLLFDPAMHRYAGLSGVNVGLLVFLACRGWQKDWTDWFWPAILVIHVAELVIEASGPGVGGGMIRFSDPTVKVATVAHLGGALSGLVLWLTNRRTAAAN